MEVAEAIEASLCCCMQFANIGLPEVTIVLPRLAFGKSKVFDNSSSGFSFEGNDFSGLLFGFSGSQRSILP